MAKQVEVRSGREAVEGLLRAKELITDELNKLSNVKPMPQIGDTVYISGWSDVFEIEVLKVHPDGHIFGRENGRDSSDADYERILAPYEYYINPPNIWP